MAIKVKQRLKKTHNRSFLAKDFESLRQELIQHARVFFPDKIQDFSEPSLAGMLVDLMATVGDSLSYYLDHNFRELDPQLAVEPQNIITHLKNAGVEIYGAAAALAELQFTITVPAELIGTSYVPRASALPVILKNTVVTSLSGIPFTTFEDLDFSLTDIDGNFIWPYSVSSVDGDGIPKSFDVVGIAIASSGKEKIEQVAVPELHEAFREIVLEEKDISVIRSVTDSDGETYYEVKSLSQDTVFIPVTNYESDSLEVRNNLEMIVATRRFIKSVDPTTRLTTIRFGSGNADVLDDDILPDPSELSLELYGRPVLQRFSIDPNSLLDTQTLGISPRNTTLAINYRYGGGSNHNVGSNSITIVDDLFLEYRKNPSASDAVTVRASVQVTNPKASQGGANAPDLEALRSTLLSARLSQGRMVTKEDVLARIYTLPNMFGRVFRANISDNPINPQSTTLHILSKDREGKLTTSPDTLKRNLTTYLNEFRLISDAYDILDGIIVNFGIKYEIVVSKNANKQQVALNINQKLAEAFNSNNFQIDQPIVMDDALQIILSENFVIAVPEFKIFSLAGENKGRSYSSSSFPFDRSTKKGIIFGPPGSLFELKFPEHDIIGSVL